MSAYTITVFLEPQTNVRGTAAPNAVLYVEPDGWHRPGYITFQIPNFQIPNKCTPEERVRIAEAFLAGVTAWRDTIVEQVEQERTALDELQAARAEIARLKGEAADSEAGETR
ncbi:hypothetical protein ACIP69_18035 [Streptomyces hygroscopicus]|uniref:hypothetical protein n=1 Tax=Streptomyces hygroscopicus TaxID=1912 RepID=UPI0037FA9469